MLPELLKFGASGNVIVVLTVVLGSTGHYSDDVDCDIDLPQVMGLMVVVLNSEDCYRSDAVT